MDFTVKLLHEIARDAKIKFYEFLTTFSMIMWAYFWYEIRESFGGFLHLILKNIECAGPKMEKIGVSKR